MSLPLSDAYEMWKDNEVTQLFLSDIKEQLDEVTKASISGSFDKIVEKAIVRNAEMFVLDRVFNWKPKELETD
jgi:hypothetical protein